MKIKLFCILLLPILIFSCSEPTPFLNTKEKNFLQQNDSIKISVFPYYPPYQFINENGEIEGVFIEYIELIEKKIGYKFQKVYYTDWPKLLQDAKKDKIDIILEIQETDERKSYLEFYSLSFESKHVIITRKNESFDITNKNDLLNKTIVLPQDYAVVDNIKKAYPSLKIATEKNEVECLKKINSGIYDAFIGPRVVSNYFIRSHKLDELIFGSEIDLRYKPGLAIDKENLILNSIIKKTLKNISQKEKQLILDNWLYSNVVPFYKTARFWIFFALITILIVICIASANYYLKYKIKQRTEELLMAKEVAEESNRLKTNFINNIPQEIKTPMNGIQGLSEILDDESLSPEKRKKYTQMIIGSSRTLISIVDDILEISKLQTDRFVVRLKEINLFELFKALFLFYEIKAKEKNIELILKNNISSAQNLVLLDKPKLNKILHALISNAIKFTEIGTVTISYEIKNEIILIDIIDTGCGISEKYQNQIREGLSLEKVSFIKDFKGFGFGLIIAKKNADFIGGKINFSSTPQKGSIFTLTLPYNPIYSSIKNDTKNHVSKGEKNLILIAEDVDTNFLFLKTILTKIEPYNFIIYRAKNGKEAVAICEENKNIDLILMDIKMPVMNGYDATKYIKKMHPDIPIIAQTAYSIDEDIQKALESGCDDFISKPVDKKALISIVQKYFSAL